MPKTYKNVEEMVKNLSDDNKFEKEALNEIRNKALSKYLFSLRCEHNLTQGQLAKKINCSQSRISKIESSYDKDITTKDLLDYGNAFGLQLEIGYRRKNVRTVDIIKHHAFKINESLNHLRKLAEKDKSMNEGVLEFHIETVYNVVKMVFDSALKLDIPESIKKSVGPIHISPPVQESSSTTEETLDNHRVSS